MGFQNPITGSQGALERPAIKSPNFVHNTSGWSIARDGSAEFNNIVIRGGSTVGGTALYYAGTPAAGNLRYSISDTAGTDPYGNAYGRGVIAYAIGFTGDVGLADGALRLGHASTNFTNGGLVRQGLTFGGDIILDTGTGDATHTDAAALQLAAGQGSQTTGSATTPRAVLLDVNVTSDADLLLSGSIVKTNAAGTPYTWQTPAYGANWAAGPGGGTVQNLQYRRDPLDNLVIIGAAHTTSNSPAAVIFNLPAGYRPAIEQRVAAVLNQGGAMSACTLQILPSGDVEVSPNLTTLGSDAYLSATVPLGHLS